MANGAKKSDLLMLKSGGPALVCIEDSHGGDTATCIWFDKNGHLQRGSVPLCALDNEREDREAHAAQMKAREDAEKAKEEQERKDAIAKLGQSMTSPLTQPINPNESWESATETEKKPA